MRTTTRSSDRALRSALQRALVLSLSLSLSLGLAAGCAPPRESVEFFVLEPESPRYRAQQTRLFDTGDETRLLSASAAVLQDLGFQIEESVHDVGFLRAAKERSAREYGQEIRRFIFGLLGSGQIPVDLQQKVAATLLTRSLEPGGDRQEVRVTFYRVVWKGDGSRPRGDGSSEYIPPGQQRMEMIRDPVIYQEFFARLSKSVFLEAHQI